MDKGGHRTTDGGRPGGAGEPWASLQMMGAYRRIKYAQLNADVFTSIGDLGQGRGVVGRCGRSPFSDEEL